MRDYEFEPEVRDGRKRRPSEEPAYLSADVGHAIEARRPDVVSRAGILHMQRMAGNSGVSSFVAQRDEDDSPVKDVVRSQGSPLDSETRSDMESRLGHDFGDVQVHTDARRARRPGRSRPTPTRSATTWSSGRAPTHRPPTRASGRWPTSHHVVQQRSGPVDGSPAAGGISVSHPSDRFEQEAERNADMAMATAPAHDAGGHDASSAPTPAAAVQRSGEEEEVQGLFVQREEAPEEEESVSKLDASVQRAGPEEEEEPAAG